MILHLLNLVFYIQWSVSGTFNSLIIDLHHERSSRNFKISQATLHKKWRFPIRISSVNVTKSAVVRRKLRIWSHLLKKSLMENFIFCAVQNMLIKVKFSANQNTKLCFFMLNLTEQSSKSDSVDVSELSKRWRFYRSAPII